MPKQILNCYSSSEKRNYRKWKKTISESGYGGATLLIKKRLQTYEEGNDQINFLNTLCEFNIARILLNQNKKFEYETGGDDFLFDNIVLAVKSIQMKRYR